MKLDERNGRAYRIRQTPRRDPTNFSRRTPACAPEIDSVKSSTYAYAVERIAREDLGMSKRSEVIYLLPR